LHEIKIKLLRGRGLIVKSLGEKSRFATMVSTTFELHFEVENVTSNYKMCFSIQNDFFQQLTKIVDNVELNPQHIQSLPTHMNFSTNIVVTRF
jgi:cysteine sulfinate desulfinase/cysteine desulfurase-like protein